MVMVSFRKKLILTVGIFYFPYAVFGMEPETFEEEKSENLVTLKSGTPQEPLTLPSPKQNNAAALEKASLSVANKNVSLKNKFSNLFKSNETQLNEKILIFDNNIRSAFKSMEKHATTKKPSETIEILRLNFYLHNERRKIINNEGQEKKFNTISKEVMAYVNNPESTESLLDRFWSPCPVSLYLATTDHLSKIGEKALQLITSSAHFLFEITKPCPKNEEEENEGEVKKKIAVESTKIKSKNTHDNLLDSLCICYPELSKRFPKKNEYLYYSAKYLTLNGCYPEAWLFIVNCTKLQEHMNGTFDEEVKWTKQLRIGYLSEVTKKNDNKPLDDAKCYLEIAKVTEKINIIKSNKCEEGDWEAGSHYLTSAIYFYLHNPEQACRTIQEWDLNILYPLAHIASEHLEGSAQNKDALTAIRIHCLKLLNEAADREETDAQFGLGKVLEEGLGVTINLDEALKWYGLANIQGHREAAEGIQRLQSILNTKKDGPEREEIIDPASPEKDEELDQWSLVYGMLNDPDTAFQCGLMYFLGQKFPQSFEHAVMCFRKAAQFGHTDALFNLGKIYAVGVSEDISRDDWQAATYYLLAADLGHVNAQYEIALMYEEGRGVPKYIQNAKIWFKKSADNKNVDAQVKVFLLSNVLPDNQKALYLCLEHAEKADLRDSNAQYRLGLIVQRVGGEGSLFRAAKCHYEAAKKGHPLAQYSLGLIFEKIGNQKYLDKAITVYRLAANQGHPNAKKRLIELYKKNPGVNQDT